jgi:serine/threonine-protein kinase
MSPRTNKSTIHGFRLLERLGAGGMAEVWRAYHEEMQLEAAVKLIHPTLASDAELVARFVEEARVQCRLRHPNIASVLNFSRANLAIVVELVPGASLRQHLDRCGGTVSMHDAVALGEQLLAALAYAHAAGVVHRDVKPANAMITADGTLKIIDFGIAKILGGRGDRTRSGAALGTPAYMAPEQILATREVDRRTDIYAAGTVLYELLTGATPFGGDDASDYQIYHRHVHQPPRDPRDKHPAIPAAARGRGDARARQSARGALRIGRRDAHRADRGGATRHHRARRAGLRAPSCRRRAAHQRSTDS